MYKILDHDTNEHVIFNSYEDACIFKGVNPKAAYKVKRNTKDRPKDFGGYDLAVHANENNTLMYVRSWLKQNHLAL
jgi:hypothetical protein